MNKDFSGILREKLLDAIEAVVVDVIVPDIQDATPRDIEKYPIQNINRKDGLVPRRNTRKDNKHRYRKPVNLDGNWYAGVTGNLRRAVGYERTIRDVRVGILSE